MGAGGEVLLALLSVVLAGVVVDELLHGMVVCVPFCCRKPSTHGSRGVSLLVVLRLSVELEDS